MGEIGGSESWREEFVNLVQETGIRFTSEAQGLSSRSTSVPEKFELRSTEVDSESLQDQIKGFAKAWGELVVEFGKGCRAVVEQNLLTEDSYIVKNIRGPLAEISARMKILNEYLPEDRDPTFAWFVIFFVFILALAALGGNFKDDVSGVLAKKLHIPPPTAVCVLLPDGRSLAYHELGVPAGRARYTIIVVHGFLFSRLAGVPGINLSLLEEYGVRMVSYDRPGYGESDPHPDRSLNSSAHDILHLADATGVKDKFWILAYSDGAMHAMAALNYIPERIAGAALFAPMVNPYDSSMIKEEATRTWEKWTRRRKFMFYLARRCPKLLNHLYGRMFLTGEHGQIDKWLSLSLGKKDMDLTARTGFQELWRRNFAETIRQGSTRPLLEEAVLQVSHWGFTLADLQAQKKCPGRGILPWLRSIYAQVECEPTGYRGPIHIWQGMDDHVVPPAMTDYVARVLPNAVVHRLPVEGHFSYLFLCDECHKEIFSSLFGSPHGPLKLTTDGIAKGYDREASLTNHSATSN